MIHIWAAGELSEWSERRERNGFNNMLCMLGFTHGEHCVAELFREVHNFRFNCGSDV